MTDKDKAAVEALMRVRCPPISKAYSHGDLAVPYDEGAQAILDAVRKGEVPGVRIAGDEECLPLERRRNAEIRAELERLKLERRDAANAADYNRRCWEGEKAHAERATAERDRLAASLTRIADRCAAEDNHDMSREERREAMRTIRDDARAALAEVGKP